MSTPTHQPRQVTIPLPRRDTPSPRASSTSLAAAASINAADLSRRSSASNRGSGSPRYERAGEKRRSQVAMNINLNDPFIPGPGELSAVDSRTSAAHSHTSSSPQTIGGIRTIADGDPHHQRAPSLGELHQELEQEQEAQVNRMLQMIRDQRLLLEQTRTQTASGSAVSSQPTSAVASSYPTGTGAILDDLTPASERSFNLSSTPTTQSHSQVSGHRSLTQQRSSSRSPALRAIDSTHEGFRTHSPSVPASLLETATVRRNSNSLRDESAYYQAETASLTRENQMLRQRIKELEKQVADMAEPSGMANGSRTGSIDRRTQRERQSSIPAVPSPLVQRGNETANED